jgi:Na+/alanine symporter
VWNYVDMTVSFMTIPNLIALILLAPVMKKEVKTYFEYINKLKAKRREKQVS